MSFFAETNLDTIPRPSSSFIYWMRPFLILSIVVGHAFAIYNDSWPRPDNVSMALDIYKYFNGFFISFHLPAFFFVSGYLYRYKKEDKKEGLRDYWSYVKKKISRLFLPGISFSFLYVIIFEDSYSIQRLLYSMLFGAGHLWFLPFLFVVAVLYRGISRYIMHTKYTVYVAVVLSVLLYIIPMEGIPFIGFLKKYVFYFLFFLLGDCFVTFSFQQKFLGHPLRKGGISIILFAILWCIVAMFSEYLLAWIIGILKLAYIGLGLMGTLYVSHFLSERYSLLSKKLIALNKDSFAIYVTHQFMMKFFLFYLAALGWGEMVIFPFLLLLCTLISTYIVIFSTRQVLQ